MKFFIGIVIWLLSLSAANAELRYQTYSGTGARPCKGCTTPLSSGTVPNINYNWGGGAVLDTGRSELVVVKFWGYLTVPGTGPKTVTFFGYHDDGLTVSLDGNTVINNWNEQGPNYWNSVSSVQLEGGKTYAIEAWFYENGGGATVQLFWDAEGQVNVIDSRYYTIAPPPPKLCCGATDIEFQKRSEHVQILNTWSNRNTSDTTVYITQIGNNNSTIVEQTGTVNNAVVYSSNGNNNTVNITQSANTSIAANYLELQITGNTNIADIRQSGASGLRSAFVRIDNNNNTLTLLQSGGNHYANIDLVGGNKTVSVNQSGSAAHNASIVLSGSATSLSLSQTGNNSAYYSINYNCNTAGGCGPITVTQGK